MKHMIALFILFVKVLICSASAGYSRTKAYIDEVVVSCSNVSPAQYEAISAQPGMDIWSIKQDRIDIRIPRESEMWLMKLGVHCTIVHDSVELLVQQFEQKMKDQQQGWFEQYQPYEDIIQWYKNITAKYSDIVKYEPSIGKSYEGRDQPAVYITGSSDPDVMKIYFQCQIHAREWITGAVCSYIVNYLVVNYGTDDNVTKLLDSVEFIFVPFVNPDGYIFSWTENRLWRKNRRIPPPGSICFGVDLNRNYDNHWNEGGSSSDPCNNNYHGTGPASEIETQNTQNFFKSHSKIIGGIDWHSYSQLILRPYGWTYADSPDEAQLKAIGDEMSNLIRAVHGMNYTSQKTIELYLTSGIASDWFYSDKANENNDGYRAAGYTMELRDNGTYQFLLPPDQIIPNGEEIIPAVMYYANALLKNPLKIE